MLIMALDHTRMYFGYGTWYSEPTNLSTTTPLLFFTRWITHFCAPVFVFLTGTSAFLYGSNKKTGQVAWYLFTRGVWLVFAELVIVNFAWTFDIMFSFRILQVIWAIGLSMLVMSFLIFLPIEAIFAIGIILVFGHNLLDSLQASGISASDFIWYILHQPHAITLRGNTISLVYPFLPWLGLMALGYTTGTFYSKNFDESERRGWLLGIGLCAVLLFTFLRGFNLYGEPRVWETQGSPVYGVMSFLNLTKYPPSLHFLLMTMGPALILLAIIESLQHKITTPVIVFGRVPFFFYVVHLYVIHALAMLALLVSGRDWHEYILSTERIRSGTLINFGFELGVVYLVWILVIVLLYPLCRWYQRYKENNPKKWWLRYF